jgi:hypothetical protein
MNLDYGLLSCCAVYSSCFFNVSEEHAASTFKVEVRMISKLMGYIVVGGGSGQQARENLAIRAMGGGGNMEPSQGQ